MSFQLEYQENDKVRKKQFKSYYECISEKERLRKKGIETQYSEFGVDKTKYVPEEPRIKNTCSQIKDFLVICNGIKDFKGAKRNKVKKAERARLKKG